MKPVVLIHMRGGVPEIIGGTEGLQVFFLDYDSFDPHPSFYSQVVDISMTEPQIIEHINYKLNDTDNTDQ